mgnify:CR=1 FL=1
MAFSGIFSCEIRGSGLPGGLRMDTIIFPHGIRFVKPSVPAGPKISERTHYVSCHPCEVIEKSDDGMLKATVGNGPTCLTVSGILLPEEVEIGDYIIIHAGFAMHKMEKTEAEESLRLFRELAQATGQEATF